MFNATFNNLSVISRRSVLLVEETTDLSQVTYKLYRIMLNRRSNRKCVILVKNEKGFKFWNYLYVKYKHVCDILVHVTIIRIKLDNVLSKHGCKKRCFLRLQP